MFARRCATWPSMGLRSTVSCSALRASSTPAWAAKWLAWAASQLACVVCSAVGEIKPCPTRARLFSSWRWAMASWAAAAWACCSAWRRRAAFSVASICASAWPARTLSPSRTCRPCSSPATRAFTKACCRALRTPDIGKSSCKWRGTSASSSLFCSARGAGLRWACSCKVCWRAWRVDCARQAPLASTATANKAATQASLCFMEKRAAKGKGAYTGQAAGCPPGRG